MSTAFVMKDHAVAGVSNGRLASETLDRLIPTWDRVETSRLRENRLYLFVLPTQKIFGVYQGRENGSLLIRTTSHEGVREIETNMVRGIYNIGGDILV